MDTKRTRLRPEELGSDANEHDVVAYMHLVELLGGDERAEELAWNGGNWTRGLVERGYERIDHGGASPSPNARWIAPDGAPLDELSLLFTVRRVYRDNDGNKQLGDNDHDILWVGTSRRQANQVAAELARREQVGCAVVASVHGQRVQIDWIGPDGTPLE
jgi:hypothetical protein